MWCDQRGPAQSEGFKSSSYGVRSGPAKRSLVKQEVTFMLVVKGITSIDLNMAGMVDLEERRLFLNMKTVKS